MLLRGGEKKKEQKEFECFEQSAEFILQPKTKFDNKIKRNHNEKDRPNC